MLASSLRTLLLINNGKVEDGCVFRFEVSCVRVETVRERKERFIKWDRGHCLWKDDGDREV